MESQFRQHSAEHGLKKFDLIVNYVPIPENWKPLHRRNLTSYSNSAKNYHQRLQEKAMVAHEMEAQGYQFDDQQKRSIANAEKVSFIKQKMLLLSKYILKNFFAFFLPRSVNAASS